MSTRHIHVNTASYDANSVTGRRDATAQESTSCRIQQPDSAANLAYAEQPGRGNADGLQLGQIDAQPGALLDTQCRHINIAAADQQQSQ